MIKASTSIFDGIDTSNVQQLLNDLDELRKQIAEGLLDEVFQIDETNDYQTLKKLVGEDFDYNNLRKKVEIAVEKMVRGGCTLKDAFGLTDEAMEAFYFMGHTMFQRRNYPAARKAFEMLLQLDPFEARYHYALAATQHKQKDFFYAAHNYIQAIIHSPINDPELHFHCADCYLKMDDLMSTIVSLGYCIEACDERQERHRQLKMRCLPMREILIKKLADRELTQEKSKKEQESAKKQAREMMGEFSPKPSSQTSS